MWLAVKCKKCGLEGKIDSDVLSQYGWVWDCYRCGTEQAYVRPVVHQKPGMGRKMPLRGLHERRERF